MDLTIKQPVTYGTISLHQSSLCVKCLGVCSDQPLFFSAISTNYPQHLTNSITGTKNLTQADDLNTAES